MKLFVKSSFKIMFVILFLLSILFLPGCSKNADSSPVNKQLSVVFIQSWGDDVNKQFKKLAEEWGQKNEVEVKLEIVPIKDMDLKMTAWIQSPVGDLALLPTNIAMVNIVKLEEISNLALDIGSHLDGYYEIGKDMAAFNNKWYNIPFYAWPHVWFYRLDLLEGWKGGFPKTFEDAKLLFGWIKEKHPDIYPLGIGLGNDEDFSMFLQSITWAYGGGIVNKDGQTIIFDNDNNKKAFQYILDIYKSGFIPKGALGWDGASNNNQFLAKQIAITANALSIDYVAKRRDPELYKQIAHSAYPAGPNGRFSFVQTFGWAIKRGSKQRDASEKFLRYLYEKKTLEELFAVGEGAIAPLQKAIGETDFWKNGRYVDAIESVASAKALGWPGPFTKEAAEVYNRRIVNSIFARVINDKISLEKALLEASDKIRLIYDKLK